MDLPVAQIYYLAAVQNRCRRALEHLIFVYVKVYGQIATVDDHFADGLNGKRELAVQPRQLGFVSVKIGEVFMPADVIPMDMRGDGGDVFIGQFADLLVNIADPEPRIDQETALAAYQEIAVRFLPMAILAYNIRRFVEFIYREPIIHFCIHF